MARRRRRGLHWAKGLIPGVSRDDEDGLLQNVDADGFDQAKERSLRRAGALTTAQVAENDAYRSYGLPVFDRRAGQAELGGYLSRGRGD